MVDNFALILIVKNLFLHYAFANGCHLRAMFGVDDGCHDITTECGTDQVLVLPWE